MIVCTNLLSRGIDIIGVAQVINFDCPDTIDDYIHRIGRTGRAGRKGVSTTFLTFDNKAIYGELKKFLEING